MFRTYAMTLIADDGTDIGGPLALPLTASRKKAVLGEWLDAHQDLMDALDPAKPADGQPSRPRRDITPRELVGLQVRLEAAVGIAILRMLPDGHPLREHYEGGEHAAAPEPWLLYGTALVERLADVGVLVSDLQEHLNAATVSVGRTPSEKEVAAAEGNSDATPK